MSKKKIQETQGQGPERCQSQLTANEPGQAKTPEWIEIVAASFQQGIPGVKARPNAKMKTSLGSYKFW